jgi:L-rhamnose mutarotase
MKQYGQTILLKDEPGVIETYVEHHANIWPEVEAGLKRIGIERMLIWLSGRRLFMFMETDDAFNMALDFRRYERETPRAAEWQRLMESLQEPVPEAREGEWWSEMRLVFELSS